MKFCRLPLVVVMVATALAVGGPASASAATLTVTTTGDELTSGDGQCSLREAIDAVNHFGVTTDCGVADGSPNTIALGPHPYQLTIKPTGADDNSTGDLNLTGTATVTGAGPALTSITASGLTDRVLTVTSTGNLGLAGLTVTGGRTPNGANGTDANNPAMTPPTPGLPGGNGGGIVNQGTLNLSDAAVTNNTAGNGGTGGAGLTVNGMGAAGGNGGAGGAIYNSGMLQLTDTTVSGNHAGTGGTGGTGGSGGAPGPGGSGGCCGNGGGIYNAGGSVKVSGSTFTDNHAGDGGAGGGGGTQLSSAGNGGGGGSGAAGSPGGAIATLGGSVTLTNSTLAANRSGVGGAGGRGTAGGFSGGPAGGGGNAGNGSAGGAIVAGAGATVTSLNATVAGNQPGSPGTPGAGAGGSGGAGAPAFGGGIYVIGTPAASLTNTLLSLNGLGNCAGSIHDAGHNLSFGDPSCPAGFASGDPKLGLLADNGGPTKTEALTAGSAAIDQIPATGAHCPATDQRAIARPQPAGGECDIGAFEVVQPSPASPSVRCVVPNLSGKTLAKARRLLAAAHCALGKVRKPKHHKGKLVVKSQSPPAGNVLSNGASVSVKLGPKPHRKKHH